MSGLERPSVPHHEMRARTDRQRAVTEPAPSAADQPDPAIAELLAMLRDPSGFSTEGVIKLLLLGQRHATASTRQADKLGVDLGVGQIRETLDSMVGTMTGRRRRRELVSLIGFVASAVSAAAMGVWLGVAPRAREAAEVAVIAPAIEAKRVAEVAVDRTAEHAERLDAIEETQRLLAGAVERLNGAVVSLTDRLPPPEATQLHVPAATVKRPRGGR